MDENALILQALGKANENLAWLADHYEEVRKSAGGRFVVIHGKRLVGVGASPDKAMEAARLSPSDLRDALIDYVPANGESWIL